MERIDPVDYQEKATKLHEGGNNCCQAVLGCCCDQFQLSPETAYRLGAFFGAGMRCGEVCGAVSGVLMALGLAYGDENNRRSQKSHEFLQAFEAAFGHLECKELVAPVGKTKKEMCPVYINFAAKYLEDEFQ